MDKFLIVVNKALNAGGYGLDVFYHGKIVLGKVKVGDQVKATWSSNLSETSHIIRGLSINGRFVNEVTEGSDCDIKINGMDPRIGTFIITNDTTLLSSACIAEFKSITELNDFIDQKLVAKFPDLNNISDVALTGNIVLNNDNEHPQIGLAFLHWIYLYEGQEIELELNDKHTLCKIVKITRRAPRVKSKSMYRKRLMK